MKDELVKIFGEKIVSTKDEYGETTIEIRPESLLEVAFALRDEQAYKFEFLSDLTAIDCGKKKFAVVYHLLSIAQKKRLRLKVKIEEGQTIPSVVSVWPTANWHERENYDLMGIVFEGHPDLSRLLSPDGFSGHPLRKEYPLRGER